MTGKILALINGGVLPLALALAVAAAPLAAAATAGELLEKAIYAEETVGNLDEAIKLYEQVIVEAKAARGAAAQAQYRLGLIYEKQGKPAEATAAFQAVVDNYPQESELVAQAGKRLPSALELLPAPWVDGEELQLNMKLATGIDVGTMIYRIESAKHGGQEAWRCWTRGLVSLNGANSLSWVLCEKDSFAPIKSFWKHSLLGEAEAAYHDGSVVIQVAGKAEPITIKLTSPVFDNEQGVELFRRLPLKVGYKMAVSVVSTLGSGEVKLTLEVPETETIEVPAGKFECYKLVLNIGQTFWVSTDERRYVVRFAAGGVTADLARIDQRQADATEEVAGDGFTLTLPAGWHSYSPDGRDDEKTSTYLLDPEAIGRAEVNSGPLESLNETERRSPQAWTKEAMKQFPQGLAGFKMREPGIVASKIGDLPAANFVADFTDDGKPMTMVGVATLGDMRAINLRLTTPADKFEDLRPQFDAIVGSLKLE